MPTPYIEGAIFERKGISDYWIGRYYFNKDCWIELKFWYASSLERNNYYITDFCQSENYSSNPKIDVDKHMLLPYRAPLSKCEVECYIENIKRLIQNHETLNEKSIVSSTQNKPQLRSQKTYQKLLGY